MPRSSARRESPRPTVSLNESLTSTLLEYRKYEFLSRAGNTTWVIEGDTSVDPVIVVNPADTE
jgi:hypothetical protein